MVLVLIPKSGWKWVAEMNKLPSRYNLFSTCRLFKRTSEKIVFLFCEMLLNPITSMCSFSSTVLQLQIYRGHMNEKNFVGLTSNSEYLSCGSETNEVFVYHKVIQKTPKELLYL